MAHNFDITDFDGADVFDLRDVIKRYEELETEIEELEDKAKAQVIANDGAWVYGGMSYEIESEAQSAALNIVGNEESELYDEKEKLEELLDSVCGYGGDEQWRGNWYPITFINESYFTDYCEELVKDIGGMPRDIPSYLVIDWEATAGNIKVDYSSVEFCGETYFYR